jgi:phosphatidylserine/phosphatidylglycerophosphate/cardiolipin synthase-like enzyme
MSAMQADENKISRRKLIDRLLAAPQYGPLIGILATSYEFKPEFFETDFLPTLLGLGAWDDRNWTSRVTVEKALAQLEGAVVFMDARCYQGRPRSLRVDITPVALNAGAALHAKVLLLVYRDAVRLHVGSANITDFGYRRNREAAALLLASETHPQHAGLIITSVEGLKSALGQWWTEAAEQIVSSALAILKRYSVQSIEDQFLWGAATSKSPFQSLVNTWPSNDVIQRITIVSPFWAEERSNNGPLAQLVARLRARGALVSNASVRLLTEAKHLGSEKYQPVLPESYESFDGRQLGIRATAEAVDPTVLPEEVDNREDVVVFRPLHAKVILLDGNTSSLAYVGSANFSNRAWGLSGPSQNIEAGILLRRDGKARSSLAGLIPKTAGSPVALDGGAKGHLAHVIENDDLNKPWPTFLREVCLIPDPLRPECLLLEIRINASAVAGNWSVALIGDANLTLLEATMPAKPEHRIELLPTTLEQLLRDQEVHVRWWIPHGETTVPINVSFAARDALPLVPGSRKPGETLLLAYYQGRITFEELFPDHDGINGVEGSGSIADSSGVDTSRIQSYQVREFVEALKGIRDDLHQTSKSTPRAMHLALHGPVSPIALARAVARGVEEGRRSPTAAGFQFFEIICCFLEALKFPTDPQYAAYWQTEIGKATEIVEALLDQIRALHSHVLSGSFFQYEKRLRTHYRSGLQK